MKPERGNSLSCNHSRDVAFDLWRPIVSVYVLAIVAALAIGIWNDVVFPSRQALIPAPLPALQCVAFAQAIFFCIFYPLAIVLRADQRAMRASHVILESLLLLVLGAVFYLPAGFISNATYIDGFRTLLYVFALLPLGWAANYVISQRLAAPWGIVLCGVLIALGLSYMHYIAAEFLSPVMVRITSEVAPPIMAWNTALPRQSELLPSPIYAWILYPGVSAIAAILARK